MRLGNYLLAAAAATMAVSPAMAAPTAMTTPLTRSVRAGTPTADGSDLRGGGVFIALIAAAAVIAGIIIVALDDNNNDSPNSP